MTKLLVLGIRSLVASAFTVLLSSEAMKPGLLPWGWEAMWRRRLKKHEQRGVAIQPSHLRQQTASKTMMFPPASVDLPAGCKCIREPRPHHYSTWGREPLQPRLQNDEQMNGYCWFKSLNFRYGWNTVIDDLLQLLLYQAPPCLLIQVKLSQISGWHPGLPLAELHSPALGGT